MLQGQVRVQANRTMATRDNPLDQKQPIDTPGCRCGRHDSVHAHDDASSGDRIHVGGEQERYEHAVVSALTRAVLPHNAARRAFIKSVGTATAMAALGQFFPLKAATELLAQGRGPLEKRNLKVGFIPITCATPIIMAHPMGFYAKHGLDVEVVKTAGWAVVRDKTLNREYDAAHMLAPMPIAISLGLGSQPIPFTVPAIENVNGQGITLAFLRSVDADANEAVGTDQGRCGLQDRGRAGLSGHRYGEVDAGDGSQPARELV